MMKSNQKYVVATIAVTGLAWAGTGSAFTIHDQGGGDCSLLNGNWSSDHQCTIPALSLGPADNLILESRLGKVVTLRIENSLINEGSIEIGKDTVLENAGTLTNAGTIGNNRGTLENDGTLSNQPPGVIDNDGQFSNLGMLDNLSNIVNTVRCDTSGQAGASCRDVPHFGNEGTFTNFADSTLINHSDGSFFNAGELINQGFIELDSGTLTNEPEGTIDNSEWVVIRTGELINQGEFHVISDGQVVNDASFINDTTDSNGVPTAGQLHINFQAVFENNHFLENHNLGVIEVGGEARLMNEHHIYNDNEAVIRTSLGGRIINRVMMVNKGDVVNNGRILNERNANVGNFCMNFSKPATLVSPSGVFENEGTIYNFQGIVGAIVGSGTLQQVPYCWTPLFPWES